MNYIDFRLFSSSQNYYPICPNIDLPLPSRASVKFNQLWQTFASALTYSSEPTAVWKRDRQANQYLEVYDPSSRKTHHFESEQAALV